MDTPELLVELRQQNAKISEALATASKALEVVANKNDPSTQTPSWNNLYAQGGLFGLGGARPDLYNLTQRPVWNSAINVMGRVMRPSIYQNEVLEVITGYLPGQGANANAICDPAPKTGVFKVCRNTVPFGIYKKGAQITLVPTLGTYRDYSITPRTINNVNMAESPFMPDIVGRMADPTGDIGMQMYHLGFDIEIDTAVVLGDGDPSRTGAARQSGWISEFRGLRNWVRTGYTDSVTGIPCPAADSVVYNFNNSITSTGAGNGTVGLSVSEALRNLYYSVQLRAQGMGMPDMTFAFVGSYKLFYRLVDVIACEYPFTRCNTTPSRDVVESGMEIVRLRNEMMSGNYFRIDDKVIPYLFFEELPEDVISNNTYNEDLFIIPLAWRGQPLTYMEYFNQDNAQIRVARELIPAGEMLVTNNGAYSMFSNFKEGCLEVSLLTQMRLVMRLTSLAGRLDNLVFEYLVQSRDAQIGRSLHANGGVSIRT